MRAEARRTYSYSHPFSSQCSPLAGPTQEAQKATAPSLQGAALLQSWMGMGSAVSEDPLPPLLRLLSSLPVSVF